MRVRAAAVTGHAIRLKKRERTSSSDARGTTRSPPTTSPSGPVPSPMKSSAPSDHACRVSITKA